MTIFATLDADDDILITKIAETLLVHENKNLYVVCIYECVLYECVYVCTCVLLRYSQRRRQDNMRVPLLHLHRHVRGLPHSVHTALYSLVSVLRH